MVEDIHSLDYSERLKFLNKISDSNHIIKAETRIVDNEFDLCKAVKHFSSQEGSEGAYLKIFNGFPYTLTGETKENIKFKNCFSWDVEVKRADKIKGANAWSYLCIIRNLKGEEVPVGKTYNCSIGRTETEPLREGDILKISFVNLNEYHDPETKKVWYNMWSPRPLLWREDKRKPDNTLTAKKLVEASHGTVAEKPWPKRYLDDDFVLPVDWKEPYEPAKATNKQLADDWRLFVAAIANLDADKDEPFTYKDIYTMATSCLKEIVKRVKAGSMKFSISKEKSEAYQKLWNAVSKKVKLIDSVEREEGLSKKDCLTCNLEVCPEECFNAHPGSIIAMTKLSNSLHAKAHLIHSESKVELTDANKDAADPYLTYPDEAKRYKGMVHAHVRGKSIHLDLRLQISKDSLVGWTLYIPSALSKTPEDFAECKRLVDAEIIPIIKEKLSDPTKKFLCGPKKPEPIQWLKYEGGVEPGGVGATKYEAGFFYIIDSFDAEYGTSKPYYHEVFLENGKLFQGRLTFRLLENREEWKQTGEGLMSWMMGVSKESTPYTITTRAVKKKWIPPYGASALPRNIRNKVPEKFQYWKVKDASQRRQLRDELVEEMKKKLLKLDAIKKGRFKILKQTFKGRKIVREGATRTRYFFVTKIGSMHWSLVSYDDLLSIESASGLVFEHVRKLWDAEGNVPSDTVLNPRPATPSFMETLDEGDVTLLIEDKFKKFVLKGEKMGGTWIAAKQTESEMWNFQKSELPHPEV